MDFEKVSHYRIHERLGEGGMGVVYKAEDTKLKRTVALKFIAPNKFEDTETKARFINEAQSAASLNHPNINTIYEIDETDGQTFIAMEYIEGQSLRERLKESPLELETMLDISIQVAEGLDEAHSRGIIHRDIKSSNVMLNSRGQAKIMDFGLAKSSGGTRLTGTAVILGTVSYMSPEQATGENVDHRTDIWSFGVMLFEMLTNKLPFKGDQDQLVLYSILNEEPYPVTGLRSGIPLELEMIINKCLEKDPEARYQSATEVIVDMKRLTRNMTSGRLYSVQATKKNLSPVKKKFRFWSIPAVCVVLLALAMGIPGIRSKILQIFNPIPAYQVLAVLPFSVSEEESEYRNICSSLDVYLTYQLGLLESFQETLLVIPINDVIEKEIDTATKARKEVGANLVITGHFMLLKDIVKLQLSLSQTDPIRQIKTEELVFNRKDVQSFLSENDLVFKVLEMLAFKVRPEVSSILADGGSDNPDALIFYAEGLNEMFSDTGNIDRAVEKFKKSQEEDPEFALAYAELGLAYWKKWKQSKDPVWVEMARIECERALKLNDSLYQVFMALGIISYGTGEYDTALKHFKTTIELDPLNRKAHVEMGYTYEAQGKWKEAENEFNLAIKLKPNYFWGYRHLGIFYYLRARYAEAERIFRIMTENLPNYDLGYTYLAIVSNRTGKVEEAILNFRKAIEIDPGKSYNYSNLGTVYYFYKKDYEKAKQNYKEANKLTPNDLTILGNLADAYRYTGENIKAENAYKEAIRIGKKDLEVNPTDSVICAKMARYYALQGDVRSARQQITIALEYGSENVEVLIVSIKVFELIKERDRAFASLDLMVTLGGDISEIRVNPDLEEFTRDPRFLQYAKEP